VKWYADRPGRFLRQALADVVALAWIGGWIWLGVQVHDTVRRLRGPGDGLVDAGGGLRDTFRNAAVSAGKVPFVGEQLANALGAGTNAGSTLVNAGNGEIDTAESLAFWLPVALVLAPVLFALLLWLPPRIRYARSAADVRRIGELARATRVTVRALHHYDRLGLLVPSSRTAGGHRCYTGEDVRRLHTILALRGFGLSLRDIAAALEAGGEDPRDILRRQLAETEERIRQAQQVRASLRRLLERDPEPSQFVTLIEEMVTMSTPLTPEQIDEMQRTRREVMGSTLGRLLDD